MSKLQNRASRYEVRHILRPLAGALPPKAPQPARRAMGVVRHIPPMHIGLATFLKRT